MIIIGKSPVGSAKKLFSAKCMCSGFQVNSEIDVFCVLRAGALVRVDAAGRRG